MGKTFKDRKDIFRARGPRKNKRKQIGNAPDIFGAHENPNTQPYVYEIDWAAHERDMEKLS